MSDPKKTNKINKKTAEADFQRWADEWEIDSDIEEMDEDDEKSFLALKRRLVRSIMNGRMKVSDSCVLSYTFKYPAEGMEITSLEFTLPKGDAVLNWDKYKDQQTIHKLNAFIGSITSMPPILFAKLDLRDLRVVQAVAQIFLAS